MAFSSGDHQLLMGFQIFICFDQIMHSLFRYNPGKEQEVALFFQAPSVLYHLYRPIFRFADSIRDEQGFPSISIKKIFLHMLRKHDHLIRMLCSHLFSEL